MLNPVLAKLAAILLMSISAPLPDTSSNIIQKAIEERSRIKTGHLLVQDTRDVAWRWEVWFDESHYRIDTMAGTEKKIVCEGCYRMGNESFVAMYSTIKAHRAPRLPQAISINDPEDAGTFTLATPDPRSLGMIPWSFLNLTQFNLEETFNGDRGRTAEKDVLDGVSCWKVVQKFSDGVRTSWIDPARDFAMLKTSFAFDDRGKEIRDTARSEYVRTATGVWFPIKVDYGRTAGAVVEEANTVTIEILSLNEPFPDDPFSLKNISWIPKNHPVSWSARRPHPEGNDLIWNGEEIVRDPNAPLAEVRGPSFLSQSLILLNVGIFLALASVYLIRRYRAASTGT